MEYHKGGNNMITFIYNETQVSSDEFTQANFELIFDRVQNTYIRRFNGFLPVDNVGDIYSFLNTNLENLITVTDNNNLTLNNCKIMFLYSDVINNVCRLELQQEQIEQQ